MESASQTIERTAGAPGPLLRVRGNWQSVRGCLYGLRFPGLVGDIAIRQTDAGRAGFIADALEQIAPGLGLPPVAGDGPDSVAKLFAEAAVAIQAYYIHPVCGPVHAGTSETPGFWRVAIPAHNMDSVRNVVAWLAMAFNRLDESGASAIEGLCQSIGQLAAILAPFAVEPTNTQHTVAAAVALNVPVMRINSAMFRLGQGCHARLIESSFTDRTSTVGARIAKNKLFTSALLNDAGLPGPRHFWATTGESAVEAGRKLGFPVVIKPLNRDNGVGVITGLKNEVELAEAYAEVSKLDDTLLVEKHFEGGDYRITIINGEILKTELRIAGGVTGDGSATVAELIARRQAMPHDQMVFRRRGTFQLTLDDEAVMLLGELGMTPECVPEKDRRITLRRRANISTGAEIVLIDPEAIHPDNAALALRATDLLLLDYAGLDLLIPDIGVSWKESDALICEVNAQPQISRRVTPHIFEQVVTRLIDPPGRIPAHLVLVAGDGPGLPHNLAMAWAQTAGCNGLATAQGVWIDGEPAVIRTGDAWLAARTLLADTAAVGALAVVPLKQVMKDGLPGDWFDSIRIAGASALPGGLENALSPHTDALTFEPDLA